MCTHDSNEPVVEINGNVNVYYEEPGELKTSIRSEEYFAAFDVVRKIERCTRDNWSGGGVSGTVQRNREQVLNVVFFTGERGAGKTSAMLSFMEFLKDYYRNTIGNDSQIPKKFQLDTKIPYMFTGIDCIDASTLNEKDDLLGSVLSNMLTKWNKEEERSSSSSGIYRGKDYDHNKRDLRMHFSKLYERLKDLRSKKDVLEKDSDVFLETLEQLSLSKNVKTSFKELVESYLRIMKYPQSRNAIGSSNHFLVIPIDDLDMNINYGFMLLEQIRRFLMLPNVIVLLSANYEQLEKICCNHYAKEFDKLEKTEYNSEYIVRLAREYLEKIVPKQNQVNLSSGQKWKYFSDSEIKLKYKPQNGIDEKEEEKKGTLCQIMGDYIEKYFGLTFQSSGRCLKYLTPDTFRELTSLIMQIYNLEEINGEENVYTYNSKYFMKEIFSTVCRKYLSIEKQDIIEMLETLEPEEQIRFLGKQFKSNVKYKDSLLGVLYSGLKESEQQTFGVICLLYFTAKLTGYAKNLEFNKNKEGEKEKICQNILGYYSHKSWGLWGNWETKMLQPISMTEDKKAMHKYISKIKFSKDGGCLNLRLEGRYKKEEGCNVFSDEDRKRLIDFQYILLFFDLGIRNSESSLWTFGEIEIKKGEKENAMKLVSRCSGRFSLSGFILNLLDGACLTKLFNKDFSECCKELNLNNENISIIPEIEKYFYEPLLPMENLELLLELGNGIERGMKIYYFQDIQNMVKQYFIVFLNVLDELDQKYGFTYKEKIKEIPLIKKVMEEETFLQLLAECIKPLMEEIVDGVLEESEWGRWS